MDDYNPDEVREAAGPIASLLAKSEKARQKLAAGTWQHTMLGDNIRALRVASSLIGASPDAANEVSREDLEEALRALASMIERVEGTKATFEPGSSQHSLQRNRLQALRIASAAVESAARVESP